MSAGAASDSRDKLIGQVLAARYQIEQRLGEGAMGTVFRARHVKVGRTFAVKVLHPHLLIDHKVSQRFEREAELAGRLRHANVIGVVDVGETPDGMRYMVMDFAAGPDLATLLSEAPMPPPRIIHLVRQLLEGLFHAHEQGLIHRDFKPENVIVERDSHDAEIPKIVDFGIAILREGGDSADGPGRLTTNGLVLGTPHYMAPEQAVADPIDHRIDLFALGIIIYEMLSGKLPFDGSGAEIARANLLLDPPPIAARVPYLEVDPLLEAFARRLMAKKRDHRPPSAKAARELLDLIDRDREAAAAALGVPLTAAREVRATQPVTPRLVDTRANATFPPPIRAAMTPPRPIDTPPQAPPLATPVALAVAPDQATVTTADVEPIGKGRKRWALIAAALAGVVGLGVVVVLATGGGGGSPPAAVPPPTVAQAEPAPVVAPPPPVEPPKPTQIETPPPVEPPKPTPAPTRPARPTHPVMKPPVGRPEIRQPDAKQAEVASPKSLPAAGPYTAAAFLAQYSSVNRELTAYEAAHGKGSSGDLMGRYKMIRYDKAVSDQQSLDAAGAILTKIHEELAHK